MRYFAHIGFNGLQYRGWQRQARVTTVQGTVESCISRIFRKPITCIGCGRTDAKVHAAQFFFHFDTDRELEIDLLWRINKVLPDDIAVFDIIPVEAGNHAQFSAIERTYEYYIHTYKDPFLSGVSTLYQEKHLNLHEMQRAANMVPNYNDFSRFCKTPGRNDSNICRVKSVKIFTNQWENRLRISISADRFVKGMVRIIAKRLLDIGNGSLTIDEFEGLLRQEGERKEITIAYPQGLYLMHVKYPFLEIPTMGQFSAPTDAPNDYWIMVNPEANESSLK